MSVNRTVAKARRGVGAGRVARHELLDLVDDGVAIPGPDEVIDARQLDVVGPRDMLGQVAPVLDAKAGRLGPMDHERRHPNGRQDAADVALVDQVDGRGGHPRARRLALVARPGADQPVVRDPLGANRLSISPLPISVSMDSSVRGMSSTGAPNS